MTNLVTVEDRLLALEAGAYRQAIRNDKVDAGIAHLAFTVGELSQGQRALALDVTEIRTELVGVNGRLDKIETTQSEHGDLLRQHGDLLRQILTKLDTLGN